MNQFPWLVKIVMDDHHYCSGSLISEEWVLTAGHCVVNHTKYDVLVGIQNSKNHSEPHRIQITTSEGIPHPDYRHVPKSKEDDIGLIHLSEPVKFNKYVKPACLPSYADQANDFADVEVTLTGWGRISNTDHTSKLHYARGVKVLSNEACQKVMPERIQLYDSQLCIKQEGKTTCSGDSGGPVNYAQKTGGQFKTIAVTSFHVGHECISEYPHIMTRVSSYLEWIESTTGIPIAP